MTVAAKATSADTTPNGSTTTTPQQISVLAERTTRVLLQIIRDNFNTQYAMQARSLSEFRDTVSAHGGTDVDTTLLAHFLAHVPLSNYDCYKPFIDKFNIKPCRKQDVENLLAPGLPGYLPITSATSGRTPKMLPKYNHGTAMLPRCPFYDPLRKTPIAAAVYCGLKDVKEIEQAPDQVVERIPVCLVTGASIRNCFGWKIDDDENRMSLTMPYYAVPWAATTISHFPSFLKIHGLFFLTRRDVDRFYVPFATHHVDLIRYIDELWETFLSCIRDGVLPDLEGIDHVREYLQVHLHADPERAAELREIGAPFSREGWATRVWPNVEGIVTRCSGPFATLIPKLKFIWGPNISINCFGYGSTETLVGRAYDMTKHDEFVLQSPDFIEFLEVSREETHENLCQAWEVEVGKHYEPIITTREGLWRYKLGDVLCITGFHPEIDAPTFKYLGRKSMKINLPHASIADYQLLEAVKAISLECTIVVQEFTTMVDNRMFPPTVGFFIEPTEPLGPNAHLARQQLFDALVSMNPEHQRALQEGLISLPTVRIVKPGTFTEYRFWKSRMPDISFGQIKVPLVLLDPDAREFIPEWILREL